MVRYNFRTITHKEYAFEFEPSTDFGAVKEAIASELGFNKPQIKLIFHSGLLKDDQTFESVGCGESDFIVLHVPRTVNKAKTTPPRATEPPKPHESPVPLLEKAPSRPDPPGFEENAAMLAELGYSIGDCKHALRAALFDTERAANYLISGHIPDVDYSNAGEAVIRSLFGNTGEEEEEEEDVVERVKAAIQSDPEQARSFLESLAATNPEIGDLIRNDTKGFLLSMGIPEDKIPDIQISHKPTSQFETLISQFTDEEKAAIHRLEMRGFDSMTILQVYDACGRDEATTLEVLMSMK